MKSIRLAALAASCLSVLAFGAPTPAPAAAPAKPAPLTEYPLSCSAAAKPLVFKGWAAASNSRIDESRDLLKQAVTADPKCVLARATLGYFTPGAEGKKMLDEALTQTAGLTEIEKLDLQATDASRNGDPEKAFALSQKMLALGPNIAVLNLSVAGYAQGLNKWEESGAAAKKAAELNPKDGAAWNLVGYANLNLHKFDDSIAAFRKYVELAPTEPNGHDSLGDALLASGQIDEAGAEYQKAIDISGGKFWQSWDGIATVKASKADWEGARAAIAKQRDAAIEPAFKVGTLRMTAWTWLAQGKLAEALKTTETLEKEAIAAKLDWPAAIAPITRGHFNLLAGKYAEALKIFTAAEKTKLDGLTDGQKKFLEAYRLAATCEAQARLGKIAEAEKALAALEALYKATPGDPNGSDFVAYSRGVLALGKKDAKGAVEALKQCTVPFDLCKLVLAEAQDKAGDAAGAIETRTAIQKANHRDQAWWYARAQVDAKLKTPGKKVATEKK